MRRTLSPFLLVALFLLARPVPLIAETGPLSSGFTAPQAPFRAGMWWNPELDGSGMDIHLSSGTLFLVWYTYEPDGAPVWYLAVNEYTGADWSASLERYTWNASAGRATAEVVGEVALEFHDAYGATFDWTLGADSGAHAIEPLLVSDGISAADHTGHWFNPDEPGYGVTINDQGSVEFAVAYVYDADGQPRWVFGHRTGELMETIQLQSFEGPCPACQYSEPVPTAAGSLSRKFDSAVDGTLTLDVRLAQPVSGDWERQSVPIRLLSNRQDGRNHPAAMARFASAEALETYLKRALADPPERFPSGIEFSPSPPRFSATTLQEAGVDESDSVKTDGRVLFAVDASDNSVRVMELHPESSTVTELRRLRMPEGAPPLREIYLVHGDEGDSKLLVGIAYTPVSSIFVTPWHYGWSWEDQSVSLQLWDLGGLGVAEPLSHVSVEGGMVESRRIGDFLYLVTRHMPSPPEGLVVNPPDEDTVRANLELLEDVSLSDLLPDLLVDGEKIGELVDHESTWLPPLLRDDPRPDLVTVTAVDLRNDPGAPDTLTVVGNTEAIYASLDAIYLASGRYVYNAFQSNLVGSYPNVTLTDIHKLGLGSGAPDYHGSASVEGHLGWHQDRKSFRMGEHGDVLGVVSSSNTMWGDLGEHRLTLLRETAQTPRHRLLEEVAHLPNAAQPKRLGKPGELLYATRFLDDRLYVVTFRKTDPLYVVDLADPERPAILGELDVFGYSDFLFPVGEDLLVGIGKDAVPAGGPGDGRFAWFQGLRIGLFDVSDPADPVELDTVVVGRRGTDSPALRQHHAFSFLPRGNGFPGRFAIPVRYHDAWGSEEISSDPRKSYSWVKTGLFLFNVLDGSVNPAGLVERGEVTSAGRWFDDIDPDGRNLDDAYSRSVIMDESVYFVNRGRIWAAPWQGPSQVVGPQ